MKKISVIVPVYNSALYLRECVDSILQQSFDDFELLLVDDGSSDGSSNICDEYAVLDNRVKVFHKKNEGVSIARNVGLDSACGEWIVFADSDDFFLPCAFAEMVENVEKSKSDILLGESKVLKQGLLIDYKIFEQSVEKNDILKTINHPALWSYIFRASIIQEKRIRFIPHLAYSEDCVFLYSVAVCAKQIHFLKKFVYVYRQNDFSVCKSTNGLRKAEHQFKAAFEMEKLMNKESLNDEERRQIHCQMMKLVEHGIYSYVVNSFSLKTYKQFREIYSRYFSVRGLFFKTLCSLLTAYRRKIITFKKNPLAKRESLISIVK